MDWDFGRVSSPYCQGSVCVCVWFTSDFPVIVRSQLPLMADGWKTILGSLGQQWQRSYQQQRALVVADSKFVQQQQLCVSEARVACQDHIIGRCGHRNPTGIWQCSCIDETMCTGAPLPCSSWRPAAECTLSSISTRPCHFYCTSSPLIGGEAAEQGDDVLPCMGKSLRQ